MKITETVKRLYKWSPVFTHFLASAVVVLINMIMDRAGLPHVDVTWLLGILGVVSVPANYATVSPAVGKG